MNDPFTVRKLLLIELTLHLLWVEVLKQVGLEVKA